MDIYLTPPIAVILLIIAVLCGHLYRDNWKKQPENWKMRAWMFGCPAGLALLALGFIPLKF